MHSGTSQILGDMSFCTRLSSHSQAKFILELRGALLLLDRNVGVVWKPPNKGTVLWTPLWVGPTSVGTPSSQEIHVLLWLFSNSNELLLKYPNRNLAQEIFNREAAAASQATHCGAVPQTRSKEGFYFINLKISVNWAERWLTTKKISVSFLTQMFRDTDRGF